MNWKRAVSRTSRWWKNNVKYLREHAAFDLIFILIGVVGLGVTCDQVRQAGRDIEITTDLAIRSQLTSQDGATSGAGLYAIDALVNDGGIRIHNLSRLVLRHADLSGVIMDGCIFHETNLQHSNLEGASLQDADMQDADLEFADMAMTNLARSNMRRVDLRRTNLKGLKGWRSIEDIELANIWNVYNPPEGFVDWAVQNGAVQIQGDSEWRALTDHDKEMLPHDG